jgi:hypothetical protein
MNKESTMKIMNCFRTKATVHSLSSVNRLVKAGKSFRRTSTRVRCAFVLLICVLLLGMPAVAQTTSANLSGTVTDPTGAFLPGATVVAASTDQNVRSTQTSDKKGYFSISNLQPGNYVLTVSHEGFRTEVLHKITLNANDTQSISVKLVVGSTGEYVNVTDQSTLVNTSGAVSNVIDQQLIDDLPLDGRSIQSLITLSPGVQTVTVDSTGGQPGQFSVNGLRSSTNYFTVDGVSANFAAAPYGGYGGLNASTAGGIGSTDQQGSFAAIAPLDDLEEFQIQTSTFAPEFGRYPGAQISLVTRSGQNHFHGSLFEYFRNDALDANDWFSDYFNGAKQALRYNDFGGSFGGPVRLPKFDGRKNSTYFFFNYEGTRFVLPQPSTQSIVPSTASRAAAPNAIASSILNAFPIANGAVVYVDGNGDPCTPGTDPTCLPTGGQYATYGWSNPSSGNVWNLRLDHNFHNKMTLFARYNRSRSSSSSRSDSNFANPSHNSTDTDTLTIGSTQTLSPRLVNQLTLNASSQTVFSSGTQDTFGGSQPFDESLMLPSSCTTCTGIIDIQGLSSASSELFSEISFNRPTYSKNRQVTGADNLSWEIHGHQLKFGADYRYLSPVSNDGAFTAGIYFPNVDGVDTNSPEFGLTVYNQGFAIAIKSFSGYAQDSWKVTPRLVLTFGTRWELDPPPNGKNGKTPLTATGYDLATLDFTNLALQPAGTPLYKTIYTNFAPRLGFSYVAHQAMNFDTVVRGGGGIFYDTGQGGFGQISFPYAQDYFLLPGGSIPGYPVFTLPVPVQYATAPPPDVTPGPSNPASVTVAVPNYKLPRVYEYNLTLQQSVGHESVVTLAYVGSSGHSLQRTSEYFFNEGPGLPVSPNFSELAVISNGSASNYNSFQAQVQSHIRKVLEMQAAYTWSHAIDNGTSDSEPNSSDPRADRGSSDFDVRHSFSAAVTYNIPSYGGPGGFVPKAILDHWSLNGIVGAHTSQPFNIYSENYTVGSLGTNFTERADVVPGEPVWIYAKYAPGTDYLIPGGKYVNPAAFTDPSSTALQGDSGRNSLRGFGFAQIDFGVHRQFPIRDKVGFQFRAELFNILNHPNFSNPTPVSAGDYVGAPPPGQLGNTLGFGESPSSLASGLGGGGNTGGFNPLFQVGGPRAVQLALRLEF